MPVTEISWLGHIVPAWNGIVRDIQTLYHETLVTPQGAGRVVLALEHRQRAGSYRARATLWYLRTQQRMGTLPRTGIAVVVDSVAMAAAWSWAAKTIQIPAVLFVPSVHAPVLAALCGDGVSVQVADGDAAVCCAVYAHSVGALVPAREDPMLAAGAGTWVRDIRCLVPNLTTVIIPGGDHGLVPGTVAASAWHGINTVLAVREDALSPPAVHRVSADGTELDGMAADHHSVQLGSVTVTATALETADRILRQYQHGVTGEGATPLAALMTPATHPGCGYQLESGETVALLLAGPPDLSRC